jgi:hypothetical protein
MTRVVLVPGVLALLPAYRSIEDPVAPLRAAVHEAVAWLGPAPRIVADERGRRVAGALLHACGLDTPPPGGSGYSTSGGVGGRAASVSDEESVLVVGNGSARRTDASPGPFDPRAVPFDEALGAALRTPDPHALRAVDRRVSDELWADTGRFAELADLLRDASLAGVDYDDAPYGVQYWVMRWQA